MGVPTAVIVTELVPPIIGVYKRGCHSGSPFVLSVFVNRKTLAERVYPLNDFLFAAFEILGYDSEQFADFSHFVFLKAAGCYCRRAEPYAGRFAGGSWIVRDLILICGNANRVETQLKISAADILGTQIHQHQMVIGASALAFSTIWC